MHVRIPTYVQWGNVLKAHPLDKIKCINSLFKLVASAQNMHNIEIDSELHQLVHVNWKVDQVVLCNIILTYCMVYLVLYHNVRISSYIYATIIDYSTLQNTLAAIITYHQFTFLISFQRSVLNKIKQFSLCVFQQILILFLKLKT